MKIDMIGRTEAINSLMQAVYTAHRTRTGITLGLNGPWGCGKTYVLDLLEEKLKNDYRDGSLKTQPRYLVMHYNCWQYDYYDEPLTAILSVVQQEIRHRIKSKSRQISVKTDKLLITAGCVLCSVLLSLSKIPPTAPKDINKWKKILTSNLGSSPSSYLNNDLSNADYLYGLFEKGENYVNQMAPFTKAISDTRVQLSQLAKEYTLVFVVDELDRCLPKYAIKVLERLHHLFSDIENCVVLIATDQKQLEKAVSSCFGSAMQPNAYLAKFIDCTYNLRPTRCTTGRFSEKYDRYFNLFHITSDQEDICQTYLTDLFDNIGMRTQEQLMMRAELLHRIHFSSDNKESYLLLLVELTLVVFYHYEISHADECNWDLMKRIPFRVNKSGAVELLYQDLGAFQVYIQQNWGYPQLRSNKKWYFDKSNTIAHTMIGCWKMLCEGNMQRQDTDWDNHDIAVSAHALQQFGRSLRKNW